MNPEIVALVESKDWNAVFSSMPPLEQSILACIGKHKRQTAEAIARQLFCQPATVYAKIAILIALGILERNKEDTLNKRSLPKIEDSIGIINRDFASFCDGKNPADYREISLEEAVNIIHVEFYNLAASRFESLEYLGKIQGNGHHLAQNISSDVVKILKERWKK